VARRSSWQVEHSPRISSWQIAGLGISAPTAHCEGVILTQTSVTLRTGGVDQRTAARARRGQSRQQLRGRTRSVEALGGQDTSREGKALDNLLQSILRPRGDGPSIAGDYAGGTSFCVGHRLRGGPKAAIMSSRPALRPVSGANRRCSCLHGVCAEQTATFGFVQFQGDERRFSPRARPCLKPT